MREEANEEGFGSLRATFHRSKDAPLITAAMENFIAVVGVLVALAGVYLTDVTGNTVYDAIGSAVIGLMLMGFALALAWESRGLLIGEGVTGRERRAVLDRVAAIDGVVNVLDLRTMHMGPDSVLVACEIDFENGRTTTEIEAIVDAVEIAVREAVPEAKRIYVEAESHELTVDREP